MDTLTLHMNHTFHVLQCFARQNDSHAVDVICVDRCFHEVDHGAKLGVENSQAESRKRTELNIAVAARGTAEA